MIRVLVLGAHGMLGSMVSRVLGRNRAFDVRSTTRTEFDAEEFALRGAGAPILHADYIVNCIGVIKPFCKDSDAVGVRRAIVVNGLFPHVLAQYARVQGSRVIQIATDCVYSGARGGYVESDVHDAVDVYGKSKSLGEVFDGSTLNVRCSIIGPEIKNRVSLLEWFLANSDGTEVNGFSHHLWNGVTTLQFASLCERVIESGRYDELVGASRLHHFIPNSTVTKYELLKLMTEIYRKDLLIREVSDIGPPVDRTLRSQFKLLESLYGSRTMRDAIEELRAYGTMLP